MLRVTSLAGYSVSNASDAMSERSPLPLGIMTVSDCIGERVATMAILSSPPVAEIVSKSSKDGLESFDLHARQRQVIGIHADLAVWHQILSATIVKMKLILL